MAKISKTISFKVSPYEAEIISKFASIHKQSLSEYIRTKLLDIQIQKDNKNDNTTQAKKYLELIATFVLQNNRYLKSTIVKDINSEEQEKIDSAIKSVIDNINNTN
jgi:hypothetical protein